MGEEGLEPSLPYENKILSLARLPVPPLARAVIIAYFGKICYNLYMNSENGGQSLNDPQRQAAAQIARRKVLAAYSGVQNRSAQNAAENGGHLKDEPITTRINSDSWKQYHSAWQNYYQKYYSDYYSKAARTYIEKERLKDARARADEEKILGSLVKASGSSTNKAGLSLNTGVKHETSAYQNAENGIVMTEGEVKESLRERIRRRATDSAKKSRKRRKMMPFIAGATVMIVILFLQYNRLIFAPIMAYVSPGNAPASQIEAVDPTITQTVSADPRLIIPKLNIDVPIRFEVPLSDVMSAMNNGVAHYRIAGASAYPGEVGNFVITGHSAGDIYSSNPYKYIFSGLERLEDGDLIYVNYNSVRYTYRVVKKQVVEPTNVASLIMTTDKPLITLVTCTPLGTSRYRLLVTGEQISPSVEGAEEAEQYTPVTTEDDSIMPSNSPSFFDGFWGFLTGS